MSSCLKRLGVRHLGVKRKVNQSTYILLQSLQQLQTVPLFLAPSEKCKHKKTYMYYHLLTIHLRCTKTRSH